MTPMKSCLCFSSPVFTLLYRTIFHIECSNYNNVFVSVFFFVFFFSVRLLSVLRGHSFFSSPPKRSMTSDFEGSFYQILSITLFSLFFLFVSVNQSIRTEQNRTYVYFDIQHTQLIVLTQILHGKEKRKEEKKHKVNNQVVSNT